MAAPKCSLSPGPMRLGRTKEKAMKPGDYMLVESKEVTPEGEKIVLVVKGDKQGFGIVGASMCITGSHRLSGKISQHGHDHHFVQSITLFPEKGKDEMLAVVIDHTQYLVSLPWREDSKSHVFDPTNRFSASGMNFVQLFRTTDFFHTLEGGIGDNVFTNNPDDTTKRYVDPDVLCQFLVGKIDLETLQDSAREAVEETSAREQFDAVMDELGKKGERITELEGMFAGARDEYIQSGKSLKSLRKLVEAYLQGQFFSGFRDSRPSNERRDLLQEIAEEQGVDPAA